MRIAIIVETFPSFSETFISNKVDKLQQKGHSLFIFCNQKNSKLYKELFSGKSNIHVILINKQRVLMYILLHPFIVFRYLESKKGIIQNIYRTIRIRSINNTSPDIVHFEFSGIGIDYLNEIDYLKGSKVVSCRGSAEKVKLLVYDERKDKFRSLLDKIDAVHCVSKDMYNTILPYCTNPKKIFINVPSINTDFFKAVNQKKNASHKIILSVGRITFQKGYATGLLTARSLKQLQIPFRWIIVGKGDKKEEIVFKIHQLELQNEVILIGRKSKDEVKKLMEKADIFFLPSVYEGIANVVLEAMSMQLPVVSTRSGGMEEVITHGFNGLLADVHDHKGLAKNISCLCRDEQLSKTIGYNARQTVIEHFNIDMQINKFEEVYHQLINKEFYTSA